MGVRDAIKGAISDMYRSRHNGVCRVNTVIERINSSKDSSTNSLIERSAQPDCPAESTKQNGDVVLSAVLVSNAQSQQHSV
jgi:hypothetical protein